MIKKSFVLFAALFLAAKNLRPATWPLVPRPQKTQQMDGSFTLTSQTHIYADWSSRKTANFLAKRIRQSTGYPLKVHWKFLQIRTIMPFCSRPKMLTQTWAMKAMN